MVMNGHPSPTFVPPPPPLSIPPRGGGGRYLVRGTREKITGAEYAEEQLELGVLEPPPGVAGNCHLVPVPPWGLGGMDMGGGYSALPHPGRRDVCAILVADGFTLLSGHFGKG